MAEPNNTKVQATLLVIRYYIKSLQPLCIIIHNKFTSLFTVSLFKLEKTLQVYLQTAKWWPCPSVVERGMSFRPNMDLMTFSLSLFWQTNTIILLRENPVRIRHLG